MWRAAGYRHSKPSAIAFAFTLIAGGFRVRITSFHHTFLVEYTER